MDPCYHPKVCNCVNDPNCRQPDDNHECCSEISPNTQSKFGVWVRNGTCNNKTGHCKSNNNKSSGRIFLIIFLFLPLLLTNSKVPKLSSLFTAIR